MGIHKRLWAVAAIGLSIALHHPQFAFALGSGSASAHPWHENHLDHLPPEVRNVVARMCRTTPRATQYFATYLHDSRLIRLDFEHLHCDNQSGFCKEGNCLRHEYQRADGHYRLTKSYYRRDDD